MAKLSLLGNRSAQEFLDHYWQKQPLLIRNAILDYQSPLSPDELAGLACEEQVESRIVIEIDDAKPWSVKYGPFDEADFSTLPATHWTLLVQECNKHIEAFDELISQFNFIPQWRIDDIMVSYAPQHGSVGPHVDQYDVFLLQAYGERRWQISQRAYSENDFRDDTPLRIFKSFTPEQEWILQPGDMLYLPPGIAHHGVAINDCMTVSIGFRAPSQLQLLSTYLDDLLTEQGDELFTPRYQDPELIAGIAPGLIDTNSVQKLKQLMIGAFDDESRLARWAGRYLTEAKNPLESFDTEFNLSCREFIDHFSTHRFLQRNSHFRFAYTTIKDNVYLYIDGAEYPMGEARDIAELLCDHRTYRYADWRERLAQPDTQQLMTRLYNRQYIVDI